MRIICVALIFNIIDLISGLLAAVKTKSLESSKMRDGLFKKVGFVICYVLAWVVDHYSAVIGLTLNVDVLPLVVVYTVTTEIISIVENAVKINPDLNKNKLLEFFKEKEAEK